eukprot:s1055_g18.t1
MHFEPGTDESSDKGDHDKGNDAGEAPRMEVESNGDYESESAQAIEPGSRVPPGVKLYDMSLLSVIFNSWRTEALNATIRKLCAQPMDFVELGITWECKLEVVVRATRSLESLVFCRLPAGSMFIQAGEEVEVTCGQGTIVRMPVTILRRFHPHISGWVTADARGAGGPVLLSMEPTPPANRPSSPLPLDVTGAPNRRHGGSRSSACDEQSHASSTMQSDQATMAVRLRQGHEQMLLPDYIEVPAPGTAQDVEQELLHWGHRCRVFQFGNAMEFLCVDRAHLPDP